MLTGPDAAYVGSRVTFWCSAPGSSRPTTYQLLRDGYVLVSAGTVSEGNQSAPVALKVTATLEGSYHCKAETGGRTGVSNSIQLSVISEHNTDCLLKVLDSHSQTYPTFSAIPEFAAPPSNTRVFSQPFPPVVYEGARLVLSCSTARGSHLSYIWFFNRKELSSNSSFAQASGNKLIMEKVTPGHAGYYSCMAWSRVQDTRRFSSSTEVRLVIKGTCCQITPSQKDECLYATSVRQSSTFALHPPSFSLHLQAKLVFLHFQRGQRLPRKRNLLVL